MGNKQIHLSGTLIDHVYIKETLMAEFSVKPIFEIIYFLDHDVIRILIEQSNGDFHTVPKSNMIR